MLKILFKWSTRLGLFVWLLILMFAGARFTEQNPQVLQINFLHWVLPEMSAGVLFTGILLLGVLLGLCAFVPSLLMGKAKMRRLRSQLSGVQKNLEFLKESTAIDPNIRS